VATRLPTLQKEEEGALLGKMLEELNVKFALQLDLNHRRTDPVRRRLTCMILMTC
jgi:hypothetical protein